MGTDEHVIYELLVALKLGEEGTRRTRQLAAAIVRRGLSDQARRIFAQHHEDEARRLGARTR